MNFMLYNSLGGGGIASLRSDPQVHLYSQYHFLLLGLLAFLYPLRAY